MLVLTRKEGEQIRIGNDVIVTVVRTSGDKVRIGIQAPSQTLILRSELQAEESKSKETITLPKEGCVFERPDQDAFSFEMDVPVLASSYCS